MKEIEYSLPNRVEDLEGKHFIIYNPEHKKGNDWHYEYANLQAAVNDGYELAELKRAIEHGYVRTCSENIEVVE